MGIEHGNLPGERFFGSQKIFVLDISVSILGHLVLLFIFLKLGFISNTQIDLFHYMDMLI